ncbi:MULTISPECIES: AmmeMemoRadiSam system radical SAM enzyme [Thermotoga]|uniref:Pyruvate formate-lyase activating enzyme, putative n=3 Tax=Thermotoga TaxID=2335 RepID=Q9X1N8_THEMA|nr:MULTISPECIES: AmmeMemoRadiSam system radical SAM enzyme [Thermotoga]MDK2898494.1 pyruvate formate lyase activating enzyme [Thermotoga sp.]AAD36618.1 pyruvate formate-lyase activating enzyme, putative [Thermotoga maritima MSB8]ABQ47254.1 Radical SAM domain protein [Thermotoga petrophila RKU-1]ADA67341.1 Radical SAM domain protein [Thermotoga petrophila RKU-10]AGL50484.1 Radical SAM, Pyruvate-formate lyase-activating enzyme like protein [Thermotoga maritima MSB8]
MERMALHFEILENGKVKCLLCPHECVLDNGQIGLCGVRKNKNGSLVSLNYGEVTAIAMDPIEKKPLFHFNPGEQIFSVGTFGCNFKCGFCQNWEISQAKPETKRVTPEQLVKIAQMNRNSKGIAFTYNEPLVWYEFVLDTSRVAVREGMYCVLVTNGFINEEPLELLFQSVHAMNIDLKGFNRDFYREIGGDLDVVLRNIEKVYNAGIHVELTTLIIPGKNDDKEDLRREFEWIADLDKDIPLHISRYFPNYKYTIPPTPIEELIEIYEMAREYLNFVYLGNVWDERYESTFCPDCGNLVIRRQGYEVEKVGLDEEGKCTKCGRQIATIIG